MRSRFGQRVAAASLVVLSACAGIAATFADDTIKPLSPAALHQALMAPEVEAGNKLYATDPAAAAAHFRRAAEAGNPMAQIYLGVMAHQGVGVAQDDAVAVTWYREAARQGYEKAQLWLAEAYLNGTGVSADPAEALRWYGIAARQGSRTAQTFLGWSYIEGKLLPQDEAEARKWLNLAVIQRDERALDLMMMLDMQDGSRLVTLMAEGKLKKALVAQRDPVAYEKSQAAMYAEGDGVPRDPVAANYWRNIVAARESGDQGTVELPPPPVQ